MMRSVCVLMSSYNGEDNICNQLDSILNQENVEVYIIIRDDGSLDSTSDIVNKYIESKSDKIKLISENNIGWKRSFIKLIEETKLFDKFDYYAFSDQDDIWLPNKLSKAIEKIEKNNSVPALYASDAACYDENGNYTRMVFGKEISELSLKYELGLAPYGCTMVWNNKLNNLLFNHLPTIEVCHDIWVNLVARYCGQVYIDSDSYIKHIIHGDNACGVAKTPMERIRKFFQIYMTKDYITPTMYIEEFDKLLGLKNYNVRDTIGCKLLEYKNNRIRKARLVKRKEFSNAGLKSKLRFICFCLINKE